MEFATQMEAAREAMRENRDVLQSLALGEVSEEQMAAWLQHTTEPKRGIGNREQGPETRD